MIFPHVQTDIAFHRDIRVTAAKAHGTWRRRGASVSGDAEYAWKSSAGPNMEYTDDSQMLEYDQEYIINNS